MSVNDRVKVLIEEFNQISDWEDRYKNIIQRGKQLAPMNEDKKIDQNLVKGCQSKVWFHAEMKEGKIYFQGDSDAAIVKGIVALLLTIYSESSPDDILNTKPDFLDEIGLKEHLSMSRANGLSSMLKQISLYAIVFKSQS
ncbi:MAG: SufE family protein [Bdellovibrionota bacterium]|nr:SufE family protein [Bdellovibrionota bacterium]